MYSSMPFLASSTTGSGRRWKNGGGENGGPCDAGGVEAGACWTGIPGQFASCRWPTPIDTPTPHAAPTSNIMATPAPMPHPMCFQFITSQVVFFVATVVALLLGEVAVAGDVVGAGVGVELGAGVGVGAGGVGPPAPPDNAPITAPGDLVAIVCCSLWLWDDEFLAIPFHYKIQILEPASGCRGDNCHQRSFATRDLEIRRVTTRHPPF